LVIRQDIKNMIWYIFNSHWNYEKFRYFFDIPTDRSVVIKKCTNNFPKRKIYKKGEPIKILHTIHMERIKCCLESNARN
jgi:hypothetical protein